MIDIHCHLIPSVDDGSQNIETTLKMLEMAASDGIRGIIATPHFIRDRFEVPYGEMKEKINKINRIIEEKGIEIKIYAGQEIMLHKNTIDDLDDGLLGGLNGSEYYLFELNPLKFDKRLTEVIYELTLHGVVPVIAHPERYKYIIENIERINRLIDEGCLFQLNAGSIEGVFGRDVKKCAKKLLKAGVYDFIGSDAHGINNRNTKLKSSIEKQRKKMREELYTLLENNRAMLEGEYGRKRKKKVTDNKKLFSFR